MLPPSPRRSGRSYAREKRAGTTGGRLRRGVVAFGVMVVVAALLAGLATGEVQSWGRAGLYATGLWSRAGGSSTIDPRLFDTPVTPAPAPPTVADEPAVLSPLAANRAADPRGSVLAAQLTRLDAHGIGGTTGYVVAGADGSTITARNGDLPMIPASTLKLLTSYAILRTLGPQATFRTTVVQVAAGRTGAGQPGAAHLVLVGGGDPYLASHPSPSAPGRPNLDQLATQVANALNAQHVTAATVDWDASLFSGPAWNPDWPQSYHDQVTPVGALWVDEGITASGRAADPARSAASAFVAALARHKVTAKLGRSTAAPSGARTIGAVTSIELGAIVEQTLLHSDNNAAEVLLRQLARATHRPASFVGGQQALKAVLTADGLWSSTMIIHDGSGLSRSDRVPLRTTVGVLTRALDSRYPMLRPIATGIPLAGVDGSLAGRFFSSGTSAAVGQVHAKTGTLTGVDALAGYTVTRSGGLVVFAFVVNHAKGDFAARVWLDRATAVVAGCGC